ncbi:MAG: YlxR family protein [Syntrophobacteraceae bacterium]|nr:YlxR family protein [Syntrophobacteraceae bacterium]
MPNPTRSRKDRPPEVKRGHIPVRTCLVCMRKRPKGELARLGLDAHSGRVVEDTRATMPGRGAYACRECLPRLRLDRRMQRAFRNRAKQVCVTDVPILEQ